MKQLLFFLSLCLMMFDINLGHASPTISKPLGIDIQTKASATKAELVSTVQSLQEGQTVVYFSSSNWSLPNILDAFLDTAGPSNVSLATWAITQQPLEKLANHIRQGNIDSLEIHLDHRIKQRAEKALAFASQIAEVHPGNIHAKILICVSDTHSLVTVGSPNFTRNPRAEAGTIFRSEAVAQFYLACLTPKRQ